MTIKDAKQIPLEAIAEKLGGRFAYERKGYEKWYYSPFRDEKTPSFKIDARDNRFKDFADSRGQGDGIDLICDYYNRNRKDPQAIKEALAYLAFFDNMPLMPRIVMPRKEKVYSDHYIVEGLSERISDKYLKKELGRRCLDGGVGEYIKQAKILNTESKKKFNCFGMENIKGGVELHMHYPDQINPKLRDFKNVSGPKAITIYPARHDVERVKAYAFSSKWDFATHIHMEGRKQNITYVIYHGDAMINDAAEYILSDPRIDTVMHFDHRDAGGVKADNDLALLLEGLTYGHLGESYKDAKDLSEWRMKHPYENFKKTTPAYFEPHPNVQSMPTYKF